MLDPARHAKRSESSDSHDGRSGPALLVYGAGTNQLPLIEASRRQGYRVIAIDRDANAPGAACADRFHCISLRDHAAIVAATRDEPIQGVVARITDAAGLASAHAFARDRGLPTACPALVEAATSKLALAHAGRRAGLPMPPRVDPDAASPLADGPILVRPDMTRRGKAGIRRVTRRVELEAARAEASASSETPDFFV